MKSGAMFVLGGIAALAIVVGYEAALYVQHRDVPVATSAAQTMQPIPVDPSWIKTGQPNFRGVEFAREPMSDVVTGVWACDGPSTFEWTFRSDEAVHLLEGRVDIDYLGRRFTLEAGHTAYFYADTRAVWHTPGPLKKAYALHHPNRLVRWYRALAGVAPVR